MNSTELGDVRSQVKCIMNSTEFGDFRYKPGFLALVTAVEKVDGEKIPIRSVEALAAVGRDLRCRI
jgi:hypothetical protein